MVVAQRDETRDRQGSHSWNNCFEAPNYFLDLEIQASPVRRYLHLPLIPQLFPLSRSLRLWELRWFFHVDYGIVDY